MIQMLFYSKHFPVMDYGMDIFLIFFLYVISEKDFGILFVIYEHYLNKQNLSASIHRRLGLRSVCLYV